MTDTKTTEKVHNWMKELDDKTKMRFAINWRIPHTLFNVASKIYPHDKEDLQVVDWGEIYRSRDLGVWSNGNKVRVGTF
jgi:hypothetical protein